jgi:site-specific DNA recombinase
VTRSTCARPRNLVSAHSLISFTNGARAFCSSKTTLHTFLIASQDGSSGGYIRISLITEESTSIEAQELILTRWAQANGHEVHLYIDEGISGSKDVERPAFERMRLDIQAGLISKVIVKSIDRLGRNLKRFVDFDLECKEHGVSIFAIEQNLDTGQAQGKMMLSLLSIFAEHESEMLAQRQRTSIAYRRSIGRNVHKTPLGFSSVTRDGGQYLKIDPEESPTVRALVDGLLAGSSVGAVARDLNDRGLLTKGGKKWTTSPVGNIARNCQIVGMTKNRRRCSSGK